jgi:hypothetical protein
MRHQSRRVRVDEAIRIDRDRYKGGFRRPFFATLVVRREKQFRL